MTRLTRSGARAIREELAELRDAQHDTHSPDERGGDDPPPSEAAAERQLQIEQRIGELERVLARAEIVDSTAGPGDPRVLFGATVTLSEVPDGRTVRYRIVGEDEAEVSSGRLSVASPLAKALMGHEIGEMISHETPRGSRTYRIDEVVHGE